MEELIRNKICLVNSRPCHPQTQWQAGTVLPGLQGGMPYFGGAADLMGYYDERRVRTLPGISQYEMPLEAFRRKIASKGLRKTNPHWMEEDSDE
ncbi:hypothetical protein CENSYa_1837 [Cenarchaeum symbiosum A]|uniref:Uncharacterized protein n=1 Tax=Cenarchaeum symbiosum (strain A) TaxID=414004 RepID=A0RYN0_CENSY|nr:hypothetical protein CENSYa_1837 [Cenarchaeum symbiosum A]